MAAKVKPLSGRRESSMITPASSPTEPCALSLPAQIAELRAEVAALRDSLAVEVCTRRIVVVDEAGEERIFTTVNDNYASIDVSWPLEGAEFGVKASMSAGADASAAVCVLVGGNMAASLGGQQLTDDSGHRAPTCATYGTLDLHKEYWQERDGQWMPAVSPDGTRYLVVDVEQGLTLRRDYSTVVGQAVMQVPFRAVGQ
jgi:hypothetical protein